jgi:hypothetical protein
MEGQCGYKTWPDIDGCLPDRRTDQLIVEDNLAGHGLPVRPRRTTLPALLASVPPF